MLFHCAFLLVCLALTVDCTLIESSRLLLNPDVDAVRIASDHEQAPDGYIFPDFVIWRIALKQNKLESATPFREHSSDERDVMKRQEEAATFNTKTEEKKRKPGCRNYYWKSWTAC
ncbi:somatostatin-like [Colossoma macropomum]|uniref:somatostatin-like n=1 Tax=Colossoma macropomum TaxID=42526 RepID=UPI00186458CA|nr:somatostatin-like [Colossoma macropomum]